MHKMTWIIIQHILFLVLIFPLHVSGEVIFKGRSEGMAYQLEVIADGLGVPWAMAFLTNKQLLITERGGKLKLLDLDNGQLKIVSGIPPVYATGQGGLLDVALPPGYHEDDWIYLTYSKPVNKLSATTLARAKFRNGGLVDWNDLLVTKSMTETSRHYGSRIAFDDDGHLFFSVGDRGKRSNGQNLFTHSGSVLRLNLDGSVPKDNPFIPHKGGLPEIWSYGHRNPQGLTYDLKNKRLWLIEHGPRGGDELNLILAGKNYGWPVISYGKEYWGPINVGEATAKVGMEQPVKYYVPSIAPGSLLLYSGSAFPVWKGDLFAGALKLTHLNRIQLNKAGHESGEERLLENLNERIRSLVQSPEGWIYLSTDSGKIMRITPAA